MNDKQHMPDPDRNDVEQKLQQLETEQLGFFSELWLFCWSQPHWWMIPLILGLLLIAVAVIATPQVAPFIYSVF
ncbi:MAG: hypothetical protein KDB03_17515 [Planctomycetales bacterium]|nr:hypothetical protein [Planctomycetales bacterium]